MQKIVKKGLSMQKGPMDDIEIRFQIIKEISQN